MTAVNLDRWANRWVGRNDLAVFEARAAALGVTVWAIGIDSSGVWTVRAHNRSNSIHEVIRFDRRHPAVLIAEILDRCEAVRDLVDADLQDRGWAPEEILQVAAQSGIAVSRG